MNTITLETDNDKALRRAAKAVSKAEKKKQIVAFATETLGIPTKRQAKAFRKLTSSFFELSNDGLRFKSAGNKLVDVTSSQCVEFFKSKKFSFLLQSSETTNTAVDQDALDADLIAKARAVDAKGHPLSLAARGELWDSPLR